MTEKSGDRVGQVLISFVADVIDFQASENPTWRSSTADQNPTVEEMIEDIVKYQCRYRDLKVDEDHLKTVKHDFLTDFIFRLNREEDHGFGTKEETEQIIWNQRRNGTFVESLNHRNGKPSVKEQETLNIYHAHQKLKKIVEQECKEDESLYGFIDSSIVKELHKIILNELPLTKGMTKPGECSNKHRFTTFQGEVYFYKKPDDMEEAMNTILDRFNSLINWLKNEKDEPSKVYKLFKTSSWLLFELLDLHPFSDGNGRLFRLLCSYVLSLVAPFPIPIYNIWCDSSTGDYCKALVSARNSVKRHPKALTTMLIESSWCSWKIFLSRLEPKE